MNTTTDKSKQMAHIQCLHAKAVMNSKLTNAVVYFRTCRNLAEATAKFLVEHTFLGAMFESSKGVLTYKVDKEGITLTKLYEGKHTYETNIKVANLERLCV